VTSLFTRRPDLLPSLAVGAPAMFWGVFWIPVRRLNEGGIDGAWVMVALYAVAIVVLAPLAPLCWRGVRAAGWGWVLTGLFTGGSFLLYGNAFLHTDVVHALFLFYLAPIWSALLGRLVLGDAITRLRLLAIALGLGGLVVMLGVESGWPLPRNVGDWLALGAGFVWSCAAVRLRQTGEVGTLEQTLGFYVCGLVIGALFFFLPFGSHDVFPALGTIGAWTWAVLVVTALIAVGGNLSLVWGARQLSPARATILLMMELIVGAVAASLITDEPFGLREILGGGLIIAAAATDMLARPAPPAGAVAQG
jgi:drug/metabolite transporter (DMT)-like permease